MERRKRSPDAEYPRAELIILFNKSGSIRERAVSAFGAGWPCTFTAFAVMLCLNLVPTTIPARSFRFSFCIPVNFSRSCRYCPGNPRDRP